MTTYSELSDPTLVAKLAQKGIKKYIAYEVPEDLVKEKYGKHFDVIMGDLKQSDDLRVLNYDGHHVFYNSLVTRQQFNQGRDEPMIGDRPKTGRLIGLFLLGGVLFNFPILTLFNLKILLFGLPLLYLYIFGVWTAFIVLIFLTNSPPKVPPPESTAYPGPSDSGDRGDPC